MTILLGKAEFARQQGVSKQAIGIQCQPGGSLADAVVDGKINPRHQAALAYAKRQKAKQKPDAAPTPPPKLAPKAGAAADDGSPDFLTRFANLRLSEIEEQFGSRPEAAAWLELLKLVEQVRTGRLKNDETDGTLIERELVVTHVFGSIEEAYRRLLSDAVRTITRQLYANAKSGVELEKSEQEARKIVSKILDPMKRRVSKALRTKSGADE